MAGRTPIGKFIHTTWTNINTRCGLYKRDTPKNKCYIGISIEFSRKEFKLWCVKQETYILSLKRPSIDRIDVNKNYALDNIRIIELSDNIKRKRYGGGHLNSKCFRGIRKLGKKYQARIGIGGKSVHIGMFNSELEAYEAYRNKFFEVHNKYPW